MNEKITNSAQYKNGKFVNSIPTDLGSLKIMIEATWKFIVGGAKDRKPKNTLPITPIDINAFDAGLYFVKVVSKDRTFTQQIEIMK